MSKRPKGRANGEVSIYEYPKGSGIWYAQLTLEHGRSKRRRASSQKEAIEKLRQLQVEREHGLELGVKQRTVTQWCTIWLETFATNLKPNIKADYGDVVRRYIATASIGKRRLDQLTPAHVQAWVNDLVRQISPRTKQRLDPQTVHNAYARLRTALALAVRQGYIARNVATDIELPAVPPTEIHPLDFAQACALLDAVDGHRWAALYRLAINLGLREGELLGLTWNAIDFKAKTIRVARQLRRVNGAFVLQTTKAQAGVRTLTLDDDLIAVLRSHRKRQAEEQLVSGSSWKDSWGLVFVTETGAPIHSSGIISHFKRTLKAAKLPKIRFHDLRHTAATLMLADRVPLVTVSKILAHSSPAITAKIYAHALDESKASAIAGLSQKLRRET